jgi:peptidoglycan/xylan/chitin deacetylase (PgdA/CDA1 family)
MMEKRLTWVYIIIAFAICFFVLMNATSFSYYKKPDNSLPYGIVSINFDDGFQSAYDTAIPILNKAGFKSTQYIISNYLGKKGYINKNEVLEMAKQGHEIGSHTRGHLHLDQISSEKMKDEIFGSKEDLQKIGIDAETFAYPYGSFNSDLEKLVKQAGYIGARITQPLLNDKSSDKFALRRQRVEAGTSFFEVKQAIDEAVREKKWVILVFHKIDNSDDSISVNPKMFQVIVDYLSENQIPVVTNEQAIAMLSR